LVHSFIAQRLQVFPEKSGFSGPWAATKDDELDGVFAGKWFWGYFSKVVWSALVE
jgi:hypothetical protein